MSALGKKSYFAPVVGSAAVERPLDAWSVLVHGDVDEAVLASTRVTNAD